METKQSQMAPLAFGNKLVGRVAAVCRQIQRELMLVGIFVSFDLPLPATSGVIDGLDLFAGHWRTSL